MLFKVVFGYWVDWSEPIFDSASKEEKEEVRSRREVFWVEAEDEDKARRYAQRFEGLETNSYEGLGDLLEISVVTPEEVKSLPSLVVYERYLPKKERLYLN
ncbi:MAG: hypothetical protein Q7R85_03940 [bacterium]|nr:hypothetical protein [bacterium]